MPKVEIFGEVDKNAKGQVTADYPAWYFDPQIEDLEESVAIKERIIRDPTVPQTEKELARQRLRQESERLEKIKASVPTLSGEERDWIAKCVKEASKLLADYLPTYTRMEKRLVDIHQEMKISESPTITISHDSNLVEFVRCCYKPISEQGKISRNHLSIVWKNGRRMLGEPTNIEELRKK